MFCRLKKHTSLVLFINFFEMFIFLISSIFYGWRMYFSLKTHLSSVIDMIMTGAGYLPLPDGASTAMNVLDILRKVVSGQEDVKELAEKKELKKKVKAG